MKTKSNQLKKPLFFLFLFIVVSCAETGLAVEPMYGEATANVNLRRYNGLHGKIIIEIKKGEKILIKDKIDEGLKMIKNLIKSTDDEQKREALRGLYGYISENRDGINALNRIEDKLILEKVKRTGAIEPNIDKTIVHRFKRRGMSWSVRGSLSLLKIKETIVNGEWDNWWHKDRDEKIELRRDKIKVLTAKDVLKRSGTDAFPLIEADIPALSGSDRNKPWAKLLRELSSIDYFTTVGTR